MTTYERTLIAHGVSPEVAARDALANELVRLTNREHPAYGVQDETIYGGAQDEGAMSAPSTGSDVASTLPPARSLTALPSRQGVGSSSRDDAEWCAFVAATSGAIR